MVGAKSNQISYVHALKTSISLKYGIPFGRWACGLSVMLKKELGCTLINKLMATAGLNVQYEPTKN